MRFPTLNQLEVKSMKKSISKCLNDKEYKHKEYLQKVLVDFEEYQKTMTLIFTASQDQDAVYKFRARYRNSENIIWRDIELLGKNTLEQLAKTIICSMGWKNDHMHGFSPLAEQHNVYEPYTEQTIYAPGWEDDPFITYKSNEIRVCQIDYIKTPKLHFVFDYGDGHEFIITYKSARKLTIKEDVHKFPKLLDQRGVAPEQYPNYSPLS